MQQSTAGRDPRRLSIPAPARRGGEPAMPNDLTTQLDRAALARYLVVVSRAIGAVHGRFPFNALFRGLQRELDGRPIAVTVAGDAPGPSTVVYCGFDGRRFETYDVAPRLPVVHWTVRRAHVIEVITDPLSFLEEPARFELPPWSLLRPPKFSNLERAEDESAPPRSDSAES